MKNRGLPADAVGVDLFAGVDVSTSIEQQPAGIEEAVFSGDVE